MATHRSLLLLLALSALLSTAMALSQGSLAEGAEMDGSSESAVSTEPEVPGEEDATVTKRPLTVTGRLEVELTVGKKAATPVVTRRAKRDAKLRARKGRRSAGLRHSSSKASGKSSISSVRLAHNLRGAGFASLGGQGALKNSGATDHCARCPRAAWARHSGSNQGGTEGPSRALLPSSFCPRKPKEYLASEAIAALTAAGYGRTAKFLQDSEMLMSVNKPATLLAPTDEAWDSVDVPRADQEPSLGALMSLHILEGMYSFDELLKSPDATHTQQYSTLYPKARLEAKVHQDGDFSSVTFRVAELPTAQPALVVKMEVFCNALVIVHVVNEVLPLQRSAVAQAEAPRDLAALKEMAGTVRDMDM